jgi:hypothetical protein
MSLLASVATAFVLDETVLVVAAAKFVFFEYG